LATLRSLDTVLDIVVPTTAIAAVALLLLGLLAHPERAALIRPAGVGLIHVAVMVLLFGLLVPAALLPLLDGSPWADIPRLLSLQDAVWFAALAAVCVGLAAALFAARASARRRRRWSRPIDTARYSEQHRWT
jgi:membrane associated rhomboid family serine protease